VVFLGLSARLAKKLLALAQEYGVETGAGRRINLKLSQREIGELVGATRESVNRQLGHWEAEGVLRFDRGYVTLLRPEALASLASLVIV
jgi:CRP-like cAMP-binding protein